MNFRSAFVSARMYVTKLSEKGDRIFRLSPSFYALIGGTMLTFTIDLVRTLVSVQTQATQNYIRFMLLSVLSISISTGSFLFLSLKLEELRREFSDRDILDAIRRRTRVKRRLRLALLIGFLSLGLGLISLTLAYFMSRNQGAVDC